MPTFIIETYLARAHVDDMGDATARLRVATPDRRAPHIRSFYVPADETAFHLVEAASLDDASALALAAGLTPDRIVEAEPAEIE